MKQKKYGPNHNIWSQTKLQLDFHLEKYENIRIAFEKYISNKYVIPLEVAKTPNLEI